ncbi:MAG: hypothetical protein PPP56_11370 [Longimonas sp.]|uniref:hypothetical protein n=1 Tax=Longimonas sp. TaxID=2039626 RepID=UPI00335CE09D
MPICPECGTFYDPTNETQPCCGACGYWPDGYGYNIPRTSDDLPPYATDMTDYSSDASVDDTDSSVSPPNSASDNDESFSPDDDLPF